MSNTEAEFDLELHFLPAWAQKPAGENRYADYVGESPRESDRRSGFRDRPARRRDQPAGRGPGGPRRPGGPPRPRGEDAGRRGFDRSRRPGPEPKPAPAPLPEVNAAFIPDDKGVDSLARQIKMTGRAYPLFDIAQMILQKPERYAVTFTVKTKPEGQSPQPLFACALDDTLWLSEEEAVRWVIEKHFDTFYQAEKVQIDPPKGTYTFVAQCGMSGVVLGPPNHHDYQVLLRKLHAERFARLPFDVYKSRVKIVKDEAVVKKWLDEQSWKTEFLCLNLPEPLKLGNREEVERHFREVHLANIIKRVETFRLGGLASRQIRSPGLARLVRQLWEDQRRFPLQVATVLSQQFAARGLQFFKVNRTVTHVAVARPHYLDMEATPVSEGVKRIVEFINSHPKCTRRDLVEALAPSPRPATPAAPPGEGSTPAAAPAPADAAEPTAEQTAVIADLHWLIHQGHVIEFANGMLDAAKKPAPRPVKPQPAPGDSLAAVPALETPDEVAPDAGEAVAPGVPEANAPLPEPQQQPDEPVAPTSNPGGPSDVSDAVASQISPTPSATVELNPPPAV